MTPSCPPPWRVRRKYAPRKRPDLGCDRDEVAKGAEPGERLALELADALPRQVELVPDRLERPRLALEAEPKLEDPPLPLRKGVERPPHALPAERLLGLVERVGGLAVGEEVAELALVVGPDGLVQRDGRLGGAERLVDVLNRQAGRLRELGLRRLAAQLDLEPARRARELLLPLDDMHGHADRARVVRDRALHRLADPPGRVRRELVAAPPVDLLDLDLREVVLEREGLEVRGRDEAALLGALDERACLLGVEQLVQLVRRQLVPNPLYVRRRRRLKLSDCRSRFLVFPGGTTLSG